MSVMTEVYVGLPGGTDPACDPGTPYQTTNMPMAPARPDQPGCACAQDDGCGGFNDGVKTIAGTCAAGVDPGRGQVTIDPDILLKAGRFNLAVNFFYRGGYGADAPYGRDRSASVNCRIFWPASGGVASITYGDFRQAAYTQGGGLFTAVAASGALSTLAYASGKFTEYAPDGMRMEYEAVAGAPTDTYLLTGVLDRSGQRHTYSYSGGLLNTIEVPGGRKATFSYAAGSPTSLLTGVQDWGNRRWTFQYDADRRLTTFGEPEGCSTGYRYTVMSVGGANTTLLWTLEDPRGYKTTYSYDAAGRIQTVAAGTAVWTWTYGPGAQYTAASMTSPSGAVTTYTIGLTSRLITGIDRPDGAHITYTYSTERVKLKEQTPAGVVYSVTYDSAWRIVASDDALGYRTSLQYDAKGNLTTLTDALNMRTTYAYDGDGSTGLMVSSTDPLGRVTAWTYQDGLVRTAVDGRGLATTLGYDGDGNLLTTQAPDGGVTSMGYDNLGRVVTVTDPLNRVTSYAYDDADHVTEVTNPAGKTTTSVYDACLLVATVNPLNEETAFTYGRFGNKLTEEDPLNHVTTWAYDNMGFLVSITDAMGNRTTLVYNDARQQTADIDALGNRTTYLYDDTGRRVAVQDARGNRTTTVYDARNDVTAIIDAKGYRTTFGYDAMGRRITVQDSLGRVSTTSYDDAGQVIAQIDAMAHATSFVYDNGGNRTGVEDANGKKTTFVYETDSNRPLYTEDALSHRVTHSYDDAGRQTGIQDARGYWYSLSYDTAGRLYTETNPLGYVTTHQYDDAGRETVRTDANGHARTTTYDAAGRPVSIQYHSGDRVTLQYDAVNRQTTVVDWGGTTTFDYSARGELTGKSIAGGLRLTMVYDSVGNRTTLTEPDGYNYTFGYDELNLCTRLSDPNANVITLQYDTAGQRTTLLDSSGLTRAYAYDPAGRLTTQIDYNGATPIGTFVDSYNAAGIRTGRVQDGVSISWTYDDIYRLIGQTKSGQAATFSYDDGGNILTKHHEGSNPLTMTYDAANRLTTSLLGTTQLTTYTYSNAGEMTVERCDQLGIWSTLVYDGEHRCLNELRASGANHTYTYGFDGLRRSALMGGAGNAVSFVWDGTDVLNEYVNGSLSSRYDVLSGETFAEKRGANRYVYGVDPLGSVVQLLDSSLSRAGTYVYWPYGEVLSHTGADSPHQFVGALGYMTNAINRTYAVMRDYRPDLGRWVTEDTIGFEGGDWNLYRYVQGRPANSVDPTGRSSRGTPPRPRPRDRFHNPDPGFQECVWGPDVRLCSAGQPARQPPVSEHECRSRCEDCLFDWIAKLAAAYADCLAQVPGNATWRKYCDGRLKGALLFARLALDACFIRCSLVPEPVDPPRPGPEPVGPPTRICDYGEVCYAVV
jgi:RHS repeat-associated protein